VIRAVRKILFVLAIFFFTSILIYATG
jgi:hypothetical protein